MCYKLRVFFSIKYYAIFKITKSIPYVKNVIMKVNFENCESLELINYSFYIMFNLLIVKKPRYFVVEKVKNLISRLADID